MARYIEAVDAIWNTTTVLDIETHIHPTPGPENSDSDPERDKAITVILSIFTFFGTLGNGLVLYVFTRQTVKLASTIFILALAATDIVTCISIIPYTVYAINVEYVLTYDVACKVYQFMITCTVPLSAFIMVAIAVDRYICICHPFVHIMTVKRAKVIVGILASFAVLLGLIPALGFSVYKVELVFIQSPVTNVTTTVTDLVFTKSGNDTAEDVIYPKYMQSAEEENKLAAQSTQKRIVYDGLCQQSATLLSKNFIDIYQKIYSSFYLISLLVVLVLYGMIYSSVTKQRARRRAQKTGGYVKKVNTQCQTDESTMPLSNLKKNNNPTTQNNMKLKVEMEGETVSTTLTTKAENGIVDSEIHPITRNASRKQSPTDTNKERKDHNRLANIKTAVMLFIVTIVFIILFLPAWLMAHRWVPFNAVVFYMYFGYNVGNPIIYAFLNQMFRENMCKILRSCQGCCKKR